MKRDEMVLPIEMDPTPRPPPDPVREGMNHYYNRDPLALQALLERYRDLLREKQCSG